MFVFSASLDEQFTGALLSYMFPLGMAHRLGMGKPF
jgi:hypothetical protein